MIICVPILYKKKPTDGFCSTLKKKLCTDFHIFNYRYSRDNDDCLFYARQSITFVARVRNILKSYTSFCVSVIVKIL